MYFSPKTSADGLVFHYDTGNTVRSYLGEPTTNLAYAANSYLNSNSNWWINSGNATFNDNDTSIQKPVIPNVDTSNLRIFSSTVTVTGGNQQLGSTIVTVSPSTTYSFSIYYYFTGTTMQVPPYVRTAVNNDSLAYFGYNGDTNYLNWPRNKWILLKATVTTQANENGIYMSSYTGDTLGEKLAYFGYQVEQKSHCTPLVLGTRSATQGLKDLTAANTINLSNVSFDANAQMTFDGTNDTVSIPSNSSNNIAGDITMELVLNRTAGYSAAVMHKEQQYTLYVYSSGAITYADSSIWSYSTFGAYGNLTAGTYHHLVATKTGGVVKIYLDGTVIINKSFGSAITQTNNTLYVGSYDGSSNYFGGEIPVAKVYNRALTADEVARNYNAIKSRFNIG